MTIGPEVNALFLKQGALAAPTRGCAAFFVHHTMTRQRLGTRSISQRATYHPRMAGPACQGSDMAVGGHSSWRNLADDVQHGITKGTCLLLRHLIGIVLHTSAHLINFVICFSVALGNSLRRCSNIRSNDSSGEYPLMPLSNSGRNATSWMKSINSGQLCISPFLISEGS